ncbi:MAG: hypothetical protein ABSD03_03030 [Vulcanimicrobiaceae bacterium]|jgi:hypothetical protein
MSSDPLYGPLLKVDRAKKHIDELNAEVRKFADRNPYRIVLEPSFNPGNPAMVALTLRIREQLPDHLALIVGDIVHNLRSSLDHLVCCLVPNGASDKDVQFPFTSSASTLEATIKSRHIDRAKPNAVDAIRGLKPYAGGNDPLNGIQLLDNMDKHRLLIPVAGASGIKHAVFSASDNPGATMLTLENLAIHGIQDGQKLIVLPKPANMELGDELDATIQVTFGDGPFKGTEVLGLLRQLTDYVEKVIVPFRGFFP